MQASDHQSNHLKSANTSTLKVSEPQKQSMNLSILTSDELLHKPKAFSNLVSAKASSNGSRSSLDRFIAAKQKEAKIRRAQQRSGSKNYVHSNAGSVSGRPPLAGMQSLTSPMSRQTPIRITSQTA